MDLSPPTKCQKARAIISAAMANLIIGSYYNFGNINQPVANYFEIDPSTTLVVVPMWLFFQTLATTCSMSIAKKIGPRVLNSVSFLLFAALNFCIGFFPGKPLFGYIFIAVYGFGAGYTLGNAYLIGLLTAWTYFEIKSIPIVTAIILFFSGLGTAVLGPIVQLIINPGGSSPITDPKVAEKVPDMFFFMGAYFLTFAILITIIQPPIIDANEEVAKREKTNDDSPTKQISIKPSLIRISEDIEYSYKDQ